MVNYSLLNVTVDNSKLGELKKLMPKRAKVGGRAYNTYAFTFNEQPLTPEEVGGLASKLAEFGAREIEFLRGK